MPTVAWTTQRKPTRNPDDLTLLWLLGGNAPAQPAECL
ncbi:MAG: hypothetical protein JWO26_3580 [Rhodospirillales bacterium]|jgi:hypothetical protein|nr:hypothetical protein [Rhodospirillales bacterium]MDB5383948.1 hypothetical protein [Rhodospirillales bacterium]